MTDYKEIYDDYWSRSDRVAESSADLADVAENIVRTCGMGKLLDIGSGEGDLVGTLLRKGVDAIGIDVSEVVNNRANRRFPNRFYIGSALELPFVDGEFDTVVSTDCLEHLSPSDALLALAEIHRVTGKYAFLQIATTEDRDKHWHLTIEGRAWWEQRCFEAGFRKHPSYYLINDYEALNHDGWQITVLLEKIPSVALKKYPLTSLVEERDLHMDMLREVGERSDAHIVRYKWAFDYIRQGDRVLDAACGLGYGSYMIGQLTHASKIVGIDGSSYAVNYANTNFSLCDKKLSYLEGELSGCLSDFEDGYFDAIVSFETLEHVREPEKLLAEFNRILSPGGRVIVSVPNDWSDETGEDPNPYHLHVYTFDKLKDQLSKQFMPEAAFQQIASGCKVSHTGNQWRSLPRTLRQVSIEGIGLPDSEWWLMVGMKNPLKPKITYRESIYGYSSPPDHLLEFERDYKNPWLLRSLLEFHFRASSPRLLECLATSVLDEFSDEVELSADKAAALAVLGYRLLDQKKIEAKYVMQFLERLCPYIETEAETPHLLRWQISHTYLAAQLYKKIGVFDQAFLLLERVCKADLTGFNPSLATKVVDASFEVGLLAISQGDVEQARLYWKHGLECAYAQLKRPLTEFVGDLEVPHEFPTIVSVEFLDSAVRCIKALRWTAVNHNRPVSQLFRVTEENWKFMIEKRWASLLSTQRLLDEKDKALGSQAELIDERYEIIQQMSEEIAHRDKWIGELRQQLIDLERIIEEKNEAVAAQAKFISERYEIIHNMNEEISSRDKWIEELRQQLIDLERIIEEKDEVIAAQAKFINERYEVIQNMNEEISNRDKWIEDLRQQLRKE